MYVVVAMRKSVAIPELPNRSATVKHTIIEAPYQHTEGRLRILEQHKKRSTS